MTLFKLAFRNLVGAGLRTVLNVLVLALTFLAIVASLGLLEGMNQQTSRAMVEAEYGGGQFWHPAYDPYDPLSLEDAHGVPPSEVQRLIQEGRASPILIAPGTMYPEGRLRPVVLKGISPEQQLLGLPTRALGQDREDSQEIPLLLGTRMAESTGLAPGDLVTLQWRDVNGTIDALDAQVVQIMSTPVQSVDLNQAWLPLERLQEMMGTPGQATLVVVERGLSSAGPGSGFSTRAEGSWTFKSPDDLLSDIRNLVRAKKVGAGIIYALLIFLAMIAIFDTQVLALFHRKKEIGTLMAMGMTRGKVMALFVVEGGLHGVLAILVGAVLGTPLLWWFSQVGWKLSEKADSYGYALGDTLYPVYSLDVLLRTGILLLAITALVSWIPTRKISRLTPTEALRGRAA
jgi:ABC-type lipoprotein release transport system permease subunit